MLKNKLKRLLHFAPFFAAWRGAKLICKYSHKGLTAAKALIYYVKWTLNKRSKVFVRLKKTGVTHIKPFRPLRWKHGVCYFTGIIKNTPVFIKTGGTVDTTKRERYAIQYACRQSEFLKKHLPALYPSREFVIEKLVDGSSLSNYKDTDDDNMILQLYSFYKELKANDIRHLDIRPANFIVTGSGKLVPIDFGYALVCTDDVYDKIEKTPAAAKIIRNLGSDFAPKNGTLDDAYSMLLTMKFVCPSLLRKYPHIWKELNEDIGERAVKL